MHHTFSQPSKTAFPVATSATAEPAEQRQSIFDNPELGKLVKEILFVLKHNRERVIACCKRIQRRNAIQRRRTEHASKMRFEAMTAQAELESCKVPEIHPMPIEPMRILP